MRTITFNNPNAKATISQRVFLARLEHRDNSKEKLTMWECGKRIDYAKNHPDKFTSKAHGKTGKVVTINGKKYIPVS